jgi:Protein of unknown function (DUF3999)
MKKVLSSLLWFALILHADFQGTSWKYRRPVAIGDGAPLAVLNLDRGIYMHAQPDLADLRIWNGQEEVPYVLDKMSGSHQQAEVSSTVLNQGVTAAGDLELTVDVGARADRKHNGLRLSTSKINFRQRVSVATSDNARAWTRVRNDGYIFDFSQDQRQVSVLDVDYPVSTRRYVRLTIFGWKDPKAVEQCWVTLDENKPPVRDVMASLKIDPQQDAKTQSTLYTWDLGVPGIPHDQLTVDVDTAEFQRAAVIEGSGDGKDWPVLGQGVLSRFHDDQSLTLDFPENHQQFLRLRIYNRDDRALLVKGATLSVIRTRVKFKPVAGGSYWLFYGNADAHVPSYDLSNLLAREAPVSETTISVGPEEGNPAYREKPLPAKPWSEQHPGILYITLGLAVAGMGTVTVRFLRKASAESR